MDPVLVVDSMDSEAETDTPDAITVMKTVPRKKKPRRDPNEEIPLNWQRKPHLADRIPALDLAEGFEIKDEIRFLPNSPDTPYYAVGDHVFIACEFSAPTLHLPEDIGASPQAFRVARIMEFKADSTRVNWLVRPDDVMYRSKDPRELYISFETGWVSCRTFRGKCVVFSVQEIKSLARFRAKPCQFWFAHLYDHITRKLWDVAVISSMKNLGSRTINELSRAVTHAILKPGKAKQIGYLNRKRKLPEEQNDEEPISEEELRALSRERLQWPFRFFDYENRELFEPTTLPESRPKSAHVEVDEWPGKPLRFYTEVIAPARTRKGVTKFRLVETPNAEPIPGFEADVDDIETLKRDKPWLQKMPQGYIPRGEDLTSTPVSLPREGLSEFVSKCQANYADSLDVRPSSVNFLDACCAIYITNSGNIDDAFLSVSRLSRKLLHEPDMSVAELSKFKTELDPFAPKSWHQAFKAVGDKPIVELCHYYWVDYPLQATVPPEQLLWDGKDRLSDPDGNNSHSEVVCTICFTTNSPEWKSLPGYVPLQLKRELADAKLVALCMRCAKLWYRYKVKWVSPSKIMNRIEQLEQSSECEPELLDDTRAYMTERDRRSKRRLLASEKKEATAKKREEIKVLKEAAKEAKKSGVEVPIEVERKLAEKTQASNASTPFPEDKNMTERNPKTNELLKPKKSQSTPKAKSKKVDVAASPESADEINLSTPKKRAHLSVNQLSLDQVEQMLDDLELVPEPTAARVANYCVVCGQLDPSMPHVVCASCGLNVHTACYGMPSMYSMNSEPNKVWICDCCDNSRGAQIADTNYQCKLCPTRGPVHASWLNGQKTSAPDALKSTTEKSWCHMRCAVWTPGVSFGDATQYRDIDTSQIDEAAWDSLCKICLDNGRQPKTLSLPALANYNSISQVSTKASAEASQEDSITDRASSKCETPSNDAAIIANSSRWANTVPADQLAKMGTTVKCDLCRDRFHVSCAADKGYKLGFTRGNNPFPVVVCSKHSGTDLVPMSMIDINMNMTVMQMHISRHRVSNSKYILPVNMLAKLEQEEKFCARNCDPVPTVFPLSINVERLKHVRGGLICDRCGNKSASYWHTRDEISSHSSPPDTADPVLCPLCYRGMNPVADRNDGAEAKNHAVQLCLRAFEYYSKALLSK